MKALRTIAVLLVVAAAFGGGYFARGTGSPRPAASDGRRILYYVDPMHPAYRSDKPGIAPDCGMTLEPVYADEGPGSATPPVPRTVLYYHDPQMPSYTATTAGVNPETGNTLEPVYAEPTPPAPGTIRIPAERQQLIGVRFATVEQEAGTRTLRTVGKVAFDETRVAHVHTRFEGWIERVFVDFTGQPVRKGQPMFSIYSPEMLASQQELLLAAKARELMKDNPLAAASAQGESLFAAAKQRLQLWDLGELAIAQVLRTGEPIRSIVVHAPVSGVVMMRNAFPNQKVTPDSDLYTIADLSHVWVLADVFEGDVPAVTTGDVGRITVPAVGGPVLTAHVDFIQPQVDPMTRTVKVRLDVTNPGARLKPDMFVNVEFEAPVATRLTVPADAVLDTGTRQTVFVDLGDGYIEPRPIQVGERIGDRITILGGLTAGERVVASGTFLVDAESQLRSAAAGMGAPAGHEQHGAPAPATPATPAPPAPDHTQHGASPARPPASQEAR